ncbi:MAG: DUF6029 family protein [Bacteroidales bacterium]
MQPRQVHNQNSWGRTGPGNRPGADPRTSPEIDPRQTRGSTQGLPEGRKGDQCSPALYPPGEFEAQHMFTKQDQGNWANAMIEYTISPSWFFSISDSYNYGNEISEKRIHYYLGSVAYVKNSLRVAMSYGKQRKGIMCVGGVCREVPASNGLMLSITGSF